jgi:hypothetical protein
MHWSQHLKASEHVKLRMHNDMNRPTAKGGATAAAEVLVECSGREKSGLIYCATACLASLSISIWLES